MIQVTRPFLPPREDCEAYIERIWDSIWLTNHSPFLVDLENKLKADLGVDHLMMMKKSTITTLPGFDNMTRSHQDKVTTFLMNIMYHG